MSANNNEITGEGISFGENGFISYSHDESTGTGTLTLKNATINYTGNEQALITSNTVDKLIIELRGNNIIQTTQNVNAISGNITLKSNYTVIEFTSTTQDGSLLLENKATNANTAVISSTVTINNDSYKNGLEPRIIYFTAMSSLTFATKAVIAIPYGISIAGVEVTSANNTNILDDANKTVSFTPANATTSPATPATLKLKGASISGGGIYTTLEDLKIDLENTNTILTGQYEGTGTSYRNGIMSTKNGTLTFVAASGGSLEITSTAAAIKGFQTINGYLETHVPYTIKSKNDNYPNQDLYRTCEIEGDSVAIKWIKISEAQTYPLWIAGTQVTESNKGNVLGDSKVSFKPAEGNTPATLTLDKATLGTNIKSTIKDLKVYLLGYNTITTENNAFIYEGGENDATLSFSTVDPSDYENLGMLTINGISSKGNIASSYAIKGLVGETSTAIDNWGLDRSSTLDTSVSGWKYQEYNTQGESFVKLLYREVYDLWIASSEHRYYSENLGNNVGDAFDPKTSTLTLTSIHDSYYNRIYSGLTALTIIINNSDNELKSISFGAPNGETISATSGMLTIKKNEESSSTVHELTLANADGGVISGFSSVTIEEPMGVKSQSPSPFTTWEGTHNAVISDEVLYDLWVGGVQVSSGNASDILGAAQSSQATAVFNTETSTLTLNGAEIMVTEEGGGAVVSGLENLTVKFEGSNSIGYGNLTTFYGFKALEGKTHNITFTASEGGNFMTQAGKDNAVFGFNKVTYNDGLVAYMDDGFFNIRKLEPELFFDIENDNNSKPVAISIKTESEVTLVSHKIAYAIDYADENIADVPETEYTDVIPLATITAGPCTVSAYTLTLDGENTKSNNTNGYYFAYKESELTIGIGATVDLKDYLLPALPEGGVLINSTAESQELISIKEGDYTITGNANGATVVKSFAEGNFTVFNQRLESEDFELKMNVTVKDVISDNTFSSGQSYGTFFNTTEAYNVPEGLKAFIITNVNEEEGTIEMTETSVLPPNTPVLMYRTSTTVSPNYVFTKASNVEPVTTKLKYTTTDKPAEESSKLYVLYNGQFVKVTSGTKILANHCYLDLANTSSGTRSYYDIDGSDGTTALREVKSEGVKGEKWNDGEWYTLQGRKFTTKPTKPGLYILNGKKVVIK